MPLAAVGTRVYYSGNRANAAAAGTVVEVRGDSWGAHYGIRFDGDEHGVQFLPAAMLSEPTEQNWRHCNKLFVLDAYEARRRAAPTPRAHVSVNPLFRRLS